MSLKRHFAKEIGFIVFSQPCVFVKCVAFPEIFICLLSYTISFCGNVLDHLAFFLLLTVCFKLHLSYFIILYRINTELAWSIEKLDSKTSRIFYETL